MKEMKNLKLTNMRLTMHQDQDRTVLRDRITSINEMIVRVKAVITRKMKKEEEKTNITTNQKPRPKEVEESHQAGGDD
jgi:hypothetical protein